MAVYRAVTTEDDNCVGLVVAGGQAKLPGGICTPRERLQMVGARSQPKDGGSSHFPLDIYLAARE